jgi:hypothetical protein
MKSKTSKNKNSSHKTSQIKNFTYNIINMKIFHSEVKAIDNFNEKNKL